LILIVNTCVNYSVFLGHWFKIGLVARIVLMGRIFSVLLLVVAIAGGFFFLRSNTSKEFFDSPVPKVFGSATEKKFLANEWFPKQVSPSSGAAGLNLSAKSAILVDFDSQKVIFAKEPNMRLPAASTIKIMTALVALENSELDDVFTVSGKAANVGENSMGLTQGEKLGLKKLLYGLILVSGNDAAVTIAEGVSGSEDAFVGRMNQKVAELGLVDSKFVNASGLDEDGKEQFTTAFDMATISHYLWENYPNFRKISSSEQIFIDANSGHKSFDLYNDTNLLTTYPGVRGIKPGFTWEAGLCLVTYAENDGKRLLGVILGSDDRRGEMKELLDFGFNSFGITISHPALD